MDKTFIEEQKRIASEKLESIKESNSEEKAITIVFEYLSSLLNPEKFTDIQKEDLRKLALEFGYTEETDFNDWLKTFVPTDKSSEGSV